jgi:DNA-binding PadR family transcriptional regulator
MSKSTDLVQGTLDMLILKIVALEPMHGWAIAHVIRQLSNDVLQSALYPALTSWSSKTEWNVSENNRRANYYALTRVGRRALAKEAEQWERLSTATSLIVNRA